MFLESEYLPGFEEKATILFNYESEVVPDRCYPVFPPIKWIEQVLDRVRFDRVTLLHRVGGLQRGRVTVRARYAGGLTVSPFLYAGEEVQA